MRGGLLGRARLVSPRRPSRAAARGRIGSPADAGRIGSPHDTPGRPRAGRAARHRPEPTSAGRRTGAAMLVLTSVAEAHRVCYFGDAVAAPFSAARTTPRTSRGLRLPY